MVGPAVSSATSTAGFRCSGSPPTSKPTASPEPVMPTLPEMSTASPSGATGYNMDEYSQFDQTFGAYKNDNKNDGENENDESCSANNTESSSMWDMMLSLYLPIMLLWLRRSMFGTANLVRSLVLGHFLRLVFGNVSGWMSENAPSWLAEMLTIQSSTHHSGKGVDSWPPPALVALALLTIFTLVFQPDGLTWIMLGKLRDAMKSFFRFSNECWDLAVEEYGLIPTFGAVSTVVVIFFLFFFMGRTLRQRRRSSSTNNSGTTAHHASSEKKKKKRRGHARHRGGGGGGGSNSNTARIKSSDSTPTSNTPERESSERSSNLPDLTVLTPVSTSGRTIGCSVPEMKELPESTTANTSSESSVPALSSPGRQQKNGGKENRSRITSVSTLDTTALSDDQSCESSSVRSIPSVSVGSTRSSSKDPEAQYPKQQRNNKQKKSNNTPSSNRRNKKTGKNSTIANDNAALPSETTSAPAPLVRNSRWDALKPSTSPNNSSSQQREQQQHQSHGGGHYDNNFGHGNNINSSHYLHKHHGRGGAGRGGRGSRKGRGGGGRHNANNRHHHQNTPKTTTTPYPNSPTVSSGLRPPVSPQSLSKRTMNPIPPPPPGFASGNGTSGGDAVIRGAPAAAFFLSNNNLADRTASSNTSEDSLKYVSDSFLSGGGGAASTFPSRSSNNGWNHRQHVKVKENPFAPDNDDSERRIEDDLQNLGDQMAGSILDF